LFAHLLQPANAEVVNVRRIRDNQKRNTRRLISRSQPEAIAARAEPHRQHDSTITDTITSKHYSILARETTMQ
jgi:hypothetical protein